MKAVVLVLMACVVAAAYGDLVCGTNFCKQHPCVSAVSARSCQRGTEFRANHAGQCGCCPACVTLLGQGAACKMYSKELGETPLAICREPLRCVNQVCTQVGPIPRA